MMLCANDLILAQVDDNTQPSEGREIPSTKSEEKESIRGYPARMRRVGTPTDVEWDLDNSFPKSDSLLELISECDEDKKQ